MNWKFTIAAVILGGTTLLHTIGGEITVHAPLLDANTDPEMGLYITLLWHFITVFLAYGTVTVLLAMRAPARWSGLATSTGLLCAAMGILFFALGILRLGTVWTAPQWILLLPIAALLLWPNRQTP